MIHTCIPYAPKETGKNLGAAYNTFMAMLPEGDWACFLDHDAMFTTADWYPQLESIVNTLPETHPGAGLLTVCTNRIGNDEQIIFRKSSREARNHDIHFHRAIGKKRQEEYGRQLRAAKHFISGVVMLLSKKVWQQTAGFTDGFLKVDIDMDRQVRALGYTTFIMDGVYCYHYYRAYGQTGEARGYAPDKNLPPVILEGYKKSWYPNVLGQTRQFGKRIMKNINPR